jgi:hypothetical protein
MDADEPSELNLSTANFKGATAWLHRCVAQAFDTSGTEDGSTVSPDVLAQAGIGPETLPKAIAAELDEGFNEEAGHILKWGLVMSLAKRNREFCGELVQKGLTETLLMCLLDSRKPVRQSIALVELHRLRLLSSKAESVADAVLTEGMLRAMTMQQFAEATTAPQSLARARYRLRNLQVRKDTVDQKRFVRHAHSAGEFILRQRMIEEHMKPILDVPLVPGGSDAGVGTEAVGTDAPVFLTAEAEGPTTEVAVANKAEEAETEPQKVEPKATDTITRHGDGRFDVRRITQGTVEDPCSARILKGLSEGVLQQGCL